ncbi:flagellar FliL protein [Roseovarius azorensis]|uniref:Flagellar protein FliL n=1 Tax=Roseovarius azorensis TaxID=1287727 RepID=A0A1H7R3X8_9RHOB|nr:flagellar basal body-associated FliL family protein [Roseovarius azorensis]SEL54883.1 flagellar FliL protein [Roseovarius azorensis]
MAETENTAEVTETPVDKPPRRPLILGLVLALLGAAGGFYAIFSDLMPLGGLQDAIRSNGTTAAEKSMIANLADLAFVPVDPLVISIGQGGQTHHLRFRAELEVKLAHKAEVEKLTPRVVDVLNNYLRALRVEDLEDSSALMRLRAQMLRRVQIVTGEDRVNDLLVMEFVLN